MVLQGGRKLPPGAFETFLLPGFEYASPIYHKKEGKETSVLADFWKGPLSLFATAGLLDLIWVLCQNLKHRKTLSCLDIGGSCAWGI